MPDEFTVTSYASDIYMAVNKIPNACGIHRRTLATAQLHLKSENKLS